MTPAEARALLAAARKDRLYALWVIALSLGLRSSEVLGLTWSLIDLEGGTLRVARGVQRVGGKLVLDELKSASSHRTLPLPKMAALALREHRARQAEERLAAGRYWYDHDLVFCTGVGGPTDPRNVNRSFRALLIRARVGVDLVEEDGGRERWVTRVRLHDLRHSCASFQFVAGRLTARGHGDPRTLRDRYHDEHLRELSGIASAGRKTAGRQLKPAMEWLLRGTRSGCLTRADHHAIPSDASYARQRGQL